jgi:hypothetical protein
MYILKISVADPDPYSESGCRRAKMTHKNRKSAGCSLLRAQDFFCILDVLYGGLGISKL